MPMTLHSTKVEAADGKHANIDARTHRGTVPHCCLKKTLLYYDVSFLRHQMLLLGLPTWQPGNLGL